MSNRRQAHYLAVGLTAALALAAPLAACAEDSAGEGAGRLTVGVAFYPVEEVVHQVGGELVNIVTVVPPGEEAHEYEPTAKQLAALSEADVVFFLGNDFQPGVEHALESLPASVRRVDLLTGLEMQPIDAELGHSEADASGEDEHAHEGDDPHVWLAPANMAAMAEAVATELATLVPADAAAFADAADRFAAELDVLDAEFTAGLASCDSTVLVTGHHAFGYLATAYGLTQMPIAGISPSEEPSAETLAEVAAFAADNGVTTIFFEENLPPDLARTVADEIGASTAVLDTVEALSREQLDAGEDYLSVMRANLAALQSGLRCT